MANDSTPRPTAFRDGTSQAGRRLAALDPSFARLDERGVRERLAFVQAFARELAYFDLGDPDRPREDWGRLLQADADLDLGARLVEDPGAVAPPGEATFTRPHVALLLVVLRLLDATRERVNDLPRRHLEHWYRDVLRMTRKPAVPDRVHALLTLASGVERVTVPAGTLLLAGRDAAGVDLHYRTTRELVVGRARVAEVRSLHAEIRVAGLEEASRRYLVAGTRHDAFLAMLRMALGEPQPGDPLPVPIHPAVPVGGAGVTFDVLMQVLALLRVTAEQLGLASFDELRLLMRLKAQREGGDAGDWAAINAILAGAARARAANAPFSTPDPTAFLVNLQAAIGVSAAQYARLFDGLSEVESIEDVYATFMRRPDVAEFVRSRLFLSADDFRTMMQTWLRLEGEWSEINRLLEQAARRRRNDPAFELPAAVRSLRDVPAKLARALGGVDFRGAGSLDGYYDAFKAIERYFFLPAEKVAYVLETGRSATPPDGDVPEWARVYAIVASAHAEKIYGRRRAALRALGEAVVTADRVRPVLAAMVSAAVGAPGFGGGDPAGYLSQTWERLRQLGLSPSDLDYLQYLAAQAPPAVDWDRVTTALEIVQRNREALPVPVPRTVEWRNLYPAADARAVTSDTTSDVARDDPGGPVRWRTFGPRERPRSIEPAPEPSFGWALASPLLTLREGTREVTVTLGFSSDLARFDRRRLLQLFEPADARSTTATFNPFVISASTEDGWTAPSTSAITWANPQMTGYPTVPGIDTSALAALTFRLTFAEQAPPLVAPSRNVHGIEASAPVVRFMIQPVWDELDRAYVTRYEALRALTVRRARIAVAAAGLADLALRNDESLLDPKQPFEPFGRAPAAGARLYLGHQELVTKRLDSLVVRMAWKNVPANLAGHYANYPAAPANAAYTARVFLADRRLPRAFPTPLGLFEAGDATAPVTRTLTPPADQGRVDGVDTRSADVGEWTRHLIWELGTPDFQHAVYPPLALQKSLELAAAAANQTPKPLTPASYQVNLPVTPTLKSLRVDYTASAEGDLDRPLVDRPGLRLLHVEPFGHVEVEPDEGESGTPLLPQYDHEGELYIGLADVTPPQHVSLLFQMAEGSANPGVTPEPVAWSVLSGNRWVSLHDGSLLGDGTRGLINSGIVELKLRPVEPSTRLPGGRYWLRAAVARAADGVCDTIDVHTNAVEAAFADQGNAPEHLAHSLPAGSITETQEPIAGLDEVSQPYSSFGGKMAEQDASFYVRVGERLRHRERAVTPWDYERLVLEKFQRLYKVKCLRADAVGQRHTPGRVDVIVIPDIRNRMPFDPFEPKAPADLIRDIERFLQDKTPPLAAVSVRNARYVPVKVRCGVRFGAGRDESYCRRLLNEELNRFLSPWAYDDGADVIIGGRVYASSIIDFIERRDYVDYVAEFKLFTSDDQGQTFAYVPETIDYHAGVPGPDCVLVAARQHQFDVIGQADYRVEVFHGINYMQVGLDFVVG